MLNVNIRPTTMVGILRLSKDLKKQLGVPLHQAQQLAAKQAGYVNLKHAQNALAKPQAAPSQRLYISASWKDRGTGALGREVWWVDLTVPYEQLVTPAQMRVQPSLARLWHNAVDHVSFQFMFQSQAAARRAICKSIRTFQFMDATKLRPSSAHSRVYPGGSSSNAIPGKDHYSSWFDPVTKIYVFVDEPYDPAALHHAGARADWATVHGFQVLKPTWPGMYNPGGSDGSRLYLVASNKSGSQLASIAQSLNNLPQAVVTDATWQGTSHEGLQLFQSPGSAMGKPAGPVQTPKPRKKISSLKSQREFPDRMPIATHETIGRQLKAVLANTRSRAGVYNRVELVRSMLDTSIQREYTPQELPMDQFCEVYYGSGPDQTFAKSLPERQRDEHIETLSEVKGVLLEHYSPSTARKLTSRIDAAVKSLQDWK